MKKIILSVLFGLSLGSMQTAVAQGDADAGKAKSAVCAACHGSTGTSAIPMYPDLAGQKEAYIVKQLKAFKDGSRTDPTMAPMAAGLSEADMNDLAAYFSSFPWGGVKEAAAATGDTSAPAAATAAVKVEINTNIIFHNGGNPTVGQTKAATCAACHGADGNSLVTIYPKLSGQGAGYIAKQLADFKAGASSESGRVDPVMAGMVAGLSEQDMADLGAFFASQKISKGNGKTNELGKKLYFSGDSERGISACVACHTANGKGVSQAKFPAVASQNVEYLTAQLQKFRSGDRTNDNNSIMRKTAVKLTDTDIEALAQFMSSL
ncbi:MAG: cytochrome c4 [Colwellia sp.]|nr:cytochrome c4 [Colwellia sp.]